jgi:acetoin utilization protein AcuB
MPLALDPALHMRQTGAYVTLHRPPFFSATLNRLLQKPPFIGDFRCFPQAAAAFPVVIIYIQIAIMMTVQRKQGMYRYDMSVQDIMTKSVISVGIEDTLATVKQIFANAGFHHLLVVEGDELIGVVSDRDLLKAMSPNIGTPLETPDDTLTLEKRVYQIMSTNLIVLADDACVGDAVRTFNNHSISCIPVVDGQQKPVGIISWRDILRILPVHKEEALGAAAR